MGISYISANSLAGVLSCPILVMSGVHSKSKRPTRTCSSRVLELDYTADMENVSLQSGFAADSCDSRRISQAGAGNLQVTEDTAVATRGYVRTVGNDIVGNAPNQESL